MTKVSAETKPKRDVDLNWWCPCSRSNRPRDVTKTTTSGKDVKRGKMATIRINWICHIEVVKETLLRVEWEVLLHPDIPPSDYDVFRSM